MAEANTSHGHILTEHGLFAAERPAVVLHSLKDLADLKERVRMQPFHDIRRKAIDLLFPPLDAETKGMLLSGYLDVSPENDKK